MSLQVILAGHNLDRQALEAHLAGQGEGLSLSPETLSAAYARISRDPRAVPEIREDARREVEKSRRSNRAIIFDMGHSSVAEHATFNLDVLGLSRLAVESLEHHRLASYTEKSQRYIRLEGEYVVPEEIRGTELEPAFRQRVEALAAFYGELAKALTAQAEQEAVGKTRRRELESRANEDARYILPLCAQAQLGMTVNARSLELMIARAAAHPLSEVQALGQALFAAVSEIASSVIRYTEPSAYFSETPKALGQFVQNWQADGKSSAPLAAEGQPFGLALIEHSPDPDQKVAEALLFAHGRNNWQSNVEGLKNAKPQQLQTLFGQVYEHMKLWDTLPRAWETIHFTFELELSAAAFGQLKRHRMASLMSQPYELSLGHTLPLSVQRAGLKDRFVEELKACEALHARIAEQHPAAAPYILTNAHRRRVRFELNGRALGHFARLRCDAEAQWDIRDIASAMVAEVQKIMPLAGAFYGGKDCVEELRQQLKV